MTERHKRMADAELVLRFMAFRDLTYLKFSDKSTTGFLDTQMKTARHVDDARLEKAEEDFKQATSLAVTVFGDKDLTILALRA